MARLSLRLLVLFVVLAMMVMMSGCAGSKVVTKTEEGYKPTHVAIGAMTVYLPTQTGTNVSSLKKLIRQNLERTLRSQGITYIPSRELEGTGVAPHNTVLIDMTVSFQNSARGGDESVDARVTYSLVRRSDSSVYSEGSVKSSDSAISQGAAVTMDKAIEYSMLSLCKDIKPIL